MLRIVGGKFKGLSIKGTGKNIKPTSELVRLSIFNILEPVISGASFLDLYAGTGAIGIEALSRGAEKVVFVDSSLDSIKIIRENIGKTDMFKQSIVVRTTLPLGLEKIRNFGPFDIIFMDPPYEKNFSNITTIQIIKNLLLKETGLLLIEHSVREELLDRHFPLIMIKSYSYGDTKISIYKYEVD